MSEYPVGAVCVATVRGQENVRVIRTVDRGWRSGESVNSVYGWHRDTHLTDIRPLVVLDLPEADLRDFARWVRENVQGFGLRVAEQIEAQTKPRITEPTGLGAVVKDAEGRLWVLVGPGAAAWAWRRTPGTWAAWSEIDAVEVLSEGVAQ